MLFLINHGPHESIITKCAIFSLLAECFPAELYLLTKLESLNGNSNFLINFITPGAIVNLNELSCLRTVNLSRNCLTEFPVELCLKSIPINVIDLSNNQISIIPNAIASLQVRVSVDHSIWSK